MSKKKFVIYDIIIMISNPLNPNTANVSWFLKIFVVK